MNELNEVKRQINSKIEEELAKQLRNIPELVENAVKSAVLSILGITKIGNGYKVAENHFSSDKNKLHAYICRVTDEAVEKHTDELIESTFKRLITRKTLPQSIVDTTIKRFETNFSYAVADKLRKEFNALEEAYVKKLKANLDAMLSDIGNINTDILDPTSFSGPIGEILLEEQAKILAEYEESVKN